MKKVLVVIAAMVILGGCTARQATTTTVGLLAAGVAGFVGADAVDAGTLAENTVDLGFEAAQASPVLDSEAQRKRDGEIAEKLVNGN